MQKARIGQSVRSLGINRTEVSDNVIARAVLIDPDPSYKYLGWDDKRKRAVEIDQDMIIKYGFRPMTRFYYLIARLNTDMMGNIVGDQFAVEYLQLSDNVNNEFALAVNEMKSFKSLAMQKVSKKGPDNKDFSYMKVTPSNQDVPQSVLDNIQKLRDTPKAIEAMWQIIDSSTSLTKAQYLQLLADESNGAAQIPAGTAAPQVQGPQPPVGYVQAPAGPQEIQGNDFQQGDEFKDM